MKNQTEQSSGRIDAGLGKGLDRSHFFHAVVKSLTTYTIGFSNIVSWQMIRVGDRTFKDDFIL